MTIKILAVDDEPRFNRLVEANLATEGFEVITAKNGAEAIEMMVSESPDMVLLDVMMPDMDGFTVLDRIREFSSVPVIMLTAKGKEADRVEGLNRGADDYIVKPYSIKELLARVRSGIRIRTKTKSHGLLTYGKIVMDINNRSVLIDKKSISIGPIEFKLLQILIQSPKQVFSRMQLLEKIWQNNLEVETRTVDVHIGRLRKAIKYVSNAEIIKTVRGFGYSLNEKT